MTKLKEGKLLEWLKVWFEFYSTEFIPQLRALSPKKVEEIYPHKEQAYLQIGEMIKAYAQCQEIKADYMNMILQRDLLQAQLEKKKPEITQKFVEKWYQVFLYMPIHLREKGLPKAIKQMLREIGMEVVGK